MLRHRIFAGYLPSSQFASGINFSRLPAQVARFTRAELRHACRNDIERRIVVAIMNHPAIGAGPTSDGQRELFELVAAGRAGFARRQPLIYDNQGAPVPSALVLKLSTDLSPSCVADCAGKPGVTNHVLYHQVLDADDIEVTDQTGSELVGRVLALIADFGVGLGDSEPLTFSALGTLLTARQAALLLSEIPKPRMIFLGVLDLLSSREGCQMGQSEINTDTAIDHRHQVDIDRGREGDVVAPIGLALERDHIGADNIRQIFGQLDSPELRQRDDALDPFRQAHILKPQTDSAVMPGSVARVAGLLPRFHPAKKVLKGGVLIPQRLCQHGCGRLRQPCVARQFFELGQTAGNIDSGNRLLAPFVRFGSGRKRPVPEPAGATEPMIQHSNLSRIRVTPDLVGPLHGRHTSIIQARSGYPKSRRASRVLPLPCEGRADDLNRRAKFTSVRI